MSITPVILKPQGSGQGEEPTAKRQKTSENGRSDTSGGAAAVVGEPAGEMDVPSTAFESAAACYICELPDIPGKFLPQKAASLGVPRGPLYGKLVKGEEVTGASGKLVRPEDVMEPSTPGPLVLIVDCPSEAFIPCLVDTQNGVGKWATDEEAREKGEFTQHDERLFYRLGRACFTLFFVCVWHLLFHPV